MKKYIVFLLFLYFAFPLYAIDLNTTIINGNNTLYNHLYQKIVDKNQSNENLNLQKALLLNLMNLSKQDTLKDQNISAPETYEEYGEMFKTYINLLIQKKNLNKSIEVNQKKLHILTSRLNELNATLTSQLFYALYTKEKLLEEKQLAQIKNRLLKIKQSLASSISTIAFDDKSLKEKIKKIHQQIVHIDISLEQLRIKEEQYSLLQETDKIESTEKEITALRIEKKALYRELINSIFEQFSSLLQEKNKQAFALHKEFLKSIHENLTSIAYIASDVDNLLSSMEKSVFGTVATLQGKGLQEFKTQVNNFWEMANEPLFTINKTHISIFKLFISLFIFIVGFIIGNLYKKNIKNFSLRNRTVTASTRTLLANLGYYVIFLITLFIVMKVLGIDLSSIALIAGALSVGIGFGLQNIISNFVSGIILMVERSVKIGDYIQLDENLRGHVVDIKMRSITVNTNSNIDVIVPNQDLIQNRVINWTMNDKIRRFEIPFGVAYGTKPQKVIEVVLNAVKNSDFTDIYITRERHTRVIMTGMGDSSVNFELFVWIVGHEILYPKRTTSRFLILIYDALYENNIEIPFPQQDLHIKSIKGDFPVTLKKERNVN